MNIGDFMLKGRGYILNINRTQKILNELLADDEYDVIECENLNKEDPEMFGEDLSDEAMLIKTDDKVYIVTRWLEFERPRIK